MAADSGVLLGIIFVPGARGISIFLIRYPLCRLSMRDGDPAQSVRLPPALGGAITEENLRRRARPVSWVLRRLGSTMALCNAAA
jgi:hypothetical protein